MWIYDYNGTKYICLRLYESKGSQMGTFMYLDFNFGVIEYYIIPRMMTILYSEKDYDNI